MIKQWMGLALLLGGLGGAAQAGVAFGAPGLTAVRGPAAKSFVGVATEGPSRVYFTGYRGVVSEVFYPAVDSQAAVDLQFLVGDAGGGFVDEEKQQDYRVQRLHPRSMSWQAQTGNAAHHWRISKRIFTDPARDALIQRVTFSALDGRRVGDFRLYLLFKPYLDNAGAGNSAATLARAGGGAALAASRNQRASALLSSLPWKTQNGRRMLSNGFVGLSDGWTDLLGGGADKRMDWTFDSAGNGNVAQMGWLELGDPRATSVSFDVVLGFGASQGRRWTRPRRRWAAIWTRRSGATTPAGRLMPPVCPIRAAAPTTATTWRR